jgi:hypothetical protein
MANKDVYECFLPSTIPDRKSAARAIAAGFFAGFIMLCVVAVISVSLFVRHESTFLSAVTSTATIVMILVTVGTWKRILAAPLVGLVVASVVIAWQLSQGKIAAIVLIVPLIGGFWTAAHSCAKAAATSSISSAHLELGNRLMCDPFAARQHKC